MNTAAMSATFLSAPASTASIDAALLQGLNPQQLQAVTLPQGHALVLAGAGSGKTRVLTSRMAWLVHTQHVGIGELLAVTFTNKAAKEMLHRLQTLLPMPMSVRGLWVGTFHGLCHRLLRLHHAQVGLPASFQILDSQDQLSAVKRLCKQFNIDEERHPPKELAWFFNDCKEEGLRPSAVAIRDDLTRQKVELFQHYEAQCQREGVVDFAELLLRSYELLRDHPELCSHYQQRFKHILVDEFQDTNRLQYAWLKQLVGPSTSVLAVGDDDQSIYAFRGARVGNMADFLREFPHVQQVKLEENYRSHQHILNAANHLIAHNSQRLGKNLRTSQGAGERIRICQTPTDYDEARWVSDEIAELLRLGQRQPAQGATLRREIAVLYRSNAQSRALEQAMMHAAIPYRVYGGLRFFDRAEIKHALAYLRLLENPRDDTSFLRVLNMPPRGIGTRSIEVLQDTAQTRQLALVDAAAHVPGRAGSAIRAFVSKLDVMREASVQHTLRDTIDMVLHQSGLLAHYRADRDGADRVENLEELINAGESFVMQEGFGRDAVRLPLDEAAPSRPNLPRPLSQSPASQGLLLGEVGQTADLWADLPPLWDGASSTSSSVSPEVILPFANDAGETLSPLAAFLSLAALEAGDQQAQSGEDAVQLMTVHAAKGLEFDHVFITGLEEQLFPHDNASQDRLGLEEERRLMYVAITRARRHLYVTHAAMRMLHGQTRFNPPSRFLDELPPADVRWLSPKAPKHRSTPTPSRSSLFAPTHTSPPAASHAPIGGAAAGGLRVGQRVFHPKFGEGQVLMIEGTGTDTRAHIQFVRHGTKWLVLSMAKLTVI